LNNLNKDQEIKNTIAQHLEDPEMREWLAELIQSSIKNKKSKLKEWFDAGKKITKKHKTGAYDPHEDEHKIMSGEVESYFD
jgi:hypothetical protein